MSPDLLPLYEAISAVYFWYSVDSASAAFKEGRPVIGAGWVVSACLGAGAGTWVAVRGVWG